MDPLSLSLSIASLVALAASTLKYTKRYVSGVVNAKSSIGALVLELDNLQSNLSSLDELLRSDSAKNLSFTRTSALRSCISACEHKLKSLRRKLDQVSDNKSGKLLWPFSEKEHLKTVQDLRTISQWLQFALSIDGCSLLSRTSNDLLKVLKQQFENFDMLRALEGQNVRMQETIREQMDVLQDKRDAEKKVDILNWISKQTYTQRHHSIESSRADGTGGWLLEQEEYTRWRDDVSSSNSLWCHGIQGVGKTVLMSLVINELQGRLPGTGSHIAFWYFDYQDQDNQAPRDVIAGLLRQVVATDPELPECLEAAYKKFHGSSLPLLELQNLLVQIIGTYAEAHCVYIILDALDECDEFRYRRILLNFIQRLQQIQNVRLLVTSRQRPHDINAAFHQNPQIEIKAQNWDLSRYMYREIEAAGVEELVDERFASEIVESIASQAQGMFLLAALQLRSVLREPTVGAMEDILSSLYNSLPEAFDETINRIRRLPESRCRLGMSTLMWISHARRPLSLSELGVALSIRSGQTTVSKKHCPSANVIVECCQGLVTIDSESSVVRLTHHSIQEYLTLCSKQLFTRPEAILAETSLQYLMFDILGHGPMESEDEIWDLIHINPFLSYSAVFWGMHVQGSESDSNVQNLTFEYLKHKKAVAAAYQITQVIKQRRDIYWTPEECFSRTPLHFATHFGLERITRRLLDQADLPVDAASKMGTTPLIVAASRGHVSMVKLLLERGADLYKENWYGNSLHCAAEAGRSNTISELISHGMSPNTCDRYDLVPLSCAIDNDHAAAFETLINLGADITARDETGLTPVHVAALHGSVNIIDLVVRRGWANIDDVSDEGRTALHYAAIGDNIIVIRKLLEAGADINLPFLEGLTLFNVARASETPVGRDITAVLLEHGADDNMETKSDTAVLINKYIWG